MNRHLVGLLVFACISSTGFCELTVKTLSLKPGEIGQIVVQNSDGTYSKPPPTIQEAMDVVRALQILLKYAPDKYPAEPVQTESGAYIIGNTSDGLPRQRKRTNAEYVKQWAETLDRTAQGQHELAERLEEEQEEIDWARCVLKRWEKRLKELQNAP